MKRREMLAGVASKPSFEPHIASPGVARFTNALLRTHENQEVKFYDDLIRGRQVVINFMYADCHGACPMVTSTLRTVHKALNNRMGKDLFFYSITVKPGNDTPAALMHYAKLRKANLPGWKFLTGDAYDIETIRFRLFGMNHPGFDLDDAMHAGTLRIINDATNVWTVVEAFASLKTIMRHISWADPPKSYAERWAESLVRQVEIDKQVKKYGYVREWM
jgi:protein SCO1/2